MAVSLSQTTLSFAGCGFLCIYHAGVCAAVKEYAPQLQRNKMAGASAGSIAAAGLICNICISQATSTILKVVTQARSRALGALHPSFNLIEVVRANLDATLPDNAHELCTGRLQISLTRECDRKNVVVSDFRSKQELIQAILCSCFIPYYCGRTPPEFRGEQYFDGGWSDNQPVIDDNTITISPFSGESDICPSDFDSASLFDFGFAGTSIRFTARNIYRMTVCLIPPSTEVCSRICRQGFEDAVRFLTRNGIVPCMRCLAVQSNLVDAYTAKITANTRTRSQHQLPSSASRRRLDAECNACIENNDVGGSTPISSLFPQIMQKTLDEALEGENRLYAYLFSFRILRWLRNLAAPVTLPFEILFIICKNITNWLAGLMTTNWVTERLQLVVDFVLKELGNQKAMYSARLSYQLAVTELDVNNTSRYWQCNEHVLNINLSADAQLELDALRRCDSLASRKRLLPSTQSSEKPLKGLAKDAAETSAEKNLEVLNHVVQYAKAHDAVLAYYYTDDVDKLRMCEIFDVRNAERRHRCHSHLEYDPPVLDSRRARYQSQLANENSDSESSPDDVFMSRRDARSSQMRAFVRSHSTRSGKTKLRRSATTSAQRRTVSSSSLRKQSTFNIGRTAATRFAAYSGVGMTPSHAAKKTSSLSSDSDVETEVFCARASDLWY